jgi:hypothetical protein
MYTCSLSYMTILMLNGVKFKNLIFICFAFHTPLDNYNKYIHIVIHIIGRGVLVNVAIGYGLDDEESIP